MEDQKWEQLTEATNTALRYWRRVHGRRDGRSRRESTRVGSNVGSAKSNSVDFDYILVRLVIHGRDGEFDLKKRSKNKYQWLRKWISPIGFPIYIPEAAFAESP